MGYDTSLLEAELEGKIKVTDNISSEMNKLNKKIQDWKSKGSRNCPDCGNQLRLNARKNRCKKALFEGY